VIALWLAVAVLLAAVLAWALRREYARLERERRRAQFRRLTRVTQSTGQAIIRLRADVTAFTNSMDQIAKTMREARTLSTADVAATEKRIRATARADTDAQADPGGVAEGDERA
jgi:hypothetical protein